MGPREDEGRNAGVGVDWQGEGRADERQAKVFGHGSAPELDLVDDEGIDSLIADRGRGVPEEHHRLHFDSAKHGSQGGEAIELAELLISRAEGAQGEIIAANLPEPQACRPDRLLEVGDLEVDDFMAPRLEPPPQCRERIEVSRRGKTQDADTTHGSSSLVIFVLVPFIFDSCRLIDRPFFVQCDFPFELLHLFPFPSFACPSLNDRRRERMELSAHMCR